MTPKTNGIVETALYVEDLERAVEFYSRVLGYRPLSDVKPERLCALASDSLPVLLLFRKGGSTEPMVIPGGIIPPNDGEGVQHIAFGINAGDYEAWKAWLIANGVEIESEVRWERGGRSIYFRDPDNHNLELATPGIWPVY